MSLSVLFQMVSLLRYVAEIVSSMNCESVYLAELDSGVPPSLLHETLVVGPPLEVHTITIDCDALS